MEIINSILKFFQDILGQAAVLIAVIALIGLLIQKKPASDVIKGTVKTFLGFLVLGAGAGVVVSALDPFGQMFQQAFKVQGVVPNNEAIVAQALVQYGSNTALIMFFGMLVNLLIARVSKFKYVFLTGHHTLYMACLLCVIFTVAGLAPWQVVVFGSLGLGITMVVFPAMAQPFMRRIVKDDSVGFGHFGTVGYVLAGLTGMVVGKNSKSTEDINFPKGLAFLRESSVSISLTMSLIYVIVAIICGPEYIQTNLSDGQNFIVFALMKAVNFAAGVFIILSGVRLLLNEIVPAFKGFSDRLIPGSKPALDCPVVFPYAPNAVLIGFFSSFVGGIVGMIVLTLTGGPIILPGVVPHFFCGASAGVFGNSTGGVKGATLGAFLHGVLITFLPVFLMPVLGNLGFANTTFSDADFCVTGILFGTAGKLGAIAVIASVLVLLALIFVLAGFIAKKKAAKSDADIKA